MANCRYIIDGKEMSAVEFEDYLLRMSPVQAAKFMPSVAGMQPMPMERTWPALVLKRMIKYAVDNGYDRIAWSPGETHADRYSLAHQISSLDYAKDPEGGGYFIVVQDKNGDYHHLNSRKPITEAALPEFVGKEVAEKMVRGEGKGPPESRTLSGLDLKVGGEGMRAFYDKMLPAEVNKLMKPYGGRVGTGEIDAPGTVRWWRFEFGDGQYSQLYETVQGVQEARDDYARERGDPPDEYPITPVDGTFGSTVQLPVHTLDITPRMRAVVSDEGLPLFVRPEDRAPHAAPDRGAVQAFIDEANRLTGGHMHIEAYDEKDDVFTIRFKDGDADKVEQVAGYVWGKLLRAAIEGDPARTQWNFDHETGHALRALGLITDKEWAALMDAAKREDWRGKYRIDTRYRGAPEWLKDEEAFVEAMADARTRPPAEGSILARVMAKLKAFFARLRNLLAGRGFQTADDIFGRIYSGEVGAREPGAHGPVRGPRTVEESVADADRFSRMTFNRRERPVKRGAKAIVERLRMEERMAQRDHSRPPLLPEQVKEVEKFIEFLGPKLVDGIGLRVRKGDFDGTRGAYYPADRIIEVFHEAIADEGLSHTTIHELWHAVERALPAKDIDAVDAEYNRAVDRWLRKNPWAEPFFDEGEFSNRLSPEASRAFIAAHGNDPKVMDKVEQTGTADDPRVRLRLTHETYRYTSPGEYFAETMTDRHFDDQDIQDAKVRSIWGHVRDIWRRMVLGFQNLFGRNATGRIYEGFRRREYEPGVGPGEGGAREMRRDADQTGSPEFKKWFGGSKVVAPDGKPLVVYHGTQADVGAFRGDATAVNRRGNVAGFYFSTNPEVAGSYAERDESASGGNLMPVYLAIKNPFIAGKSPLTEKMLAEYRKELVRTNPQLPPSSDWFDGKVRQAAKSGDLSPGALNGDGAALRRIYEAGGFDGAKDGHEWIAFEPGQIKSAIGNRGTFDAGDPRVTFARRPTDTPERREDMATRVDARARLEAVPRIGRALAAVYDAARTTGQLAERATHELLFPMRLGSPVAQAVAQRFANQLREIGERYGRLDRDWQERFSPMERRHMAHAMTNQSLFEVMLREDLNGMPEEERASYEAEARRLFNGDGHGLAGLPTDLRETLEAADEINATVWQMLGDAGLVQPGAQRIPFYFPRQGVLGEEGLPYRLPSSADEVPRADDEESGGRRGERRRATAMEPTGLNLTASGPMRRHWLKWEDTEAAGRARFGENFKLVDDVRMLTHAWARAERAVVGRELVDQIKAYGEDSNLEWVREGARPARGQWFTLDHPAMMRWVPKWPQHPDADGKIAPMRDPEGNIIYERQPIHISTDFKGPLQAVLSGAPGMWYKGAMMLKGASMHAIMWNPLKHLQVEIGRAFPLLPGKIITLEWISQGSQEIADRAAMKEWIGRYGISPIGQGWGLDPATVMEQAEAPYGRIPGLVALRQLADNAARTVGRKLGPVAEKIARHPQQELLWNMVYRLQMAIAVTMRDRFMEGGLDRDTASFASAYLANRFAGALPPEHLSKWANQLSNILMFSRSFTLGNLGVGKDAIKGPPQQIVSLIAHELGPEKAAQAAAAIKQAAKGAFIADMGLFYVFNGLMQSWIGYAAKLAAGAAALGAAKSMFDDWLEDARIAMTEEYDPFRLLPQQWNEEGKTDRIYLYTDATGRGVYVRPSIGKVGEDLVGWNAHPGKMVQNKASPHFKSLVEAILGKDAFGRAIRNPHPHGVGEWAEAIYDSTKHAIVTPFIPDVAGPIGAIANGTAAQDPFGTFLETAFMLSGFGTISHGASPREPGMSGPETGEKYAEMERLDWMRQNVMKKANPYIRRGDLAKASEIIQESRLPEPEKVQMLRRLRPATTLSPTTRRLIESGWDASRTTGARQ